MTTFYRDSAVYVGSAEFQVEDQAYRLADLELVWHRRGPRGAPGAAIIAGRFLLIAAVLGGIAAVVVAVLDIDITGYSSGTVLAGLIAGAVLAVAIGLFVVEGVITLIERSYEKGSVEHQIWARYLNSDILIFATRDKLRFGKIYRALQRAIEHSDAA
ncbi:hypothetical protein GCM10009557_19260 [Virgisporangium ochraceum]|uniref:Uncharacterized protein n=2 Tax=Virgisporangium ochraceum TaxID=65505 RepID=A0A8J4EC74_9ACTN|nr:hypothetical protein Voc01_041400 [Virgisporangium ochraceum]